MTPFQATAEVVWQRLPRQPQDTSAIVHLSELRVQPSFSSAPMIQSLLRDVFHSAAAEQRVSKTLVQWTLVGCSVQTLAILLGFPSPCNFTSFKYRQSGQPLIA